MIRLSRLNGSSFILNCELIETIEETPDSVITTINGKKLVVAESAEEIVLKVIEYKNRLSLK
ncbi:flagellar protein FlbD [Anaerobacterium chartisolvens]|uniref:Flagellar protein FlbD n=1 Tax=Anaerobacterium chartisolvens TaxID=1297424 RepID=A0A369B1H2_9FIRM|nr:flagellar FlbD family protein [Anaerobacterium chartisolvens]RCX15520.1 flagellar protein FlbD [Anaerobacterium chartisolvens]